jgi:hypothetical protein
MFLYSQPVLAEHFSISKPDFQVPKLLEHLKKQNMNIKGSFIKKNHTIKARKQYNWLSSFSFKRKTKKLIMHGNLHWKQLGPFLQNNEIGHRVNINENIF